MKESLSGDDWSDRVGVQVESKLVERTYSSASLKKYDIDSLGLTTQSLSITVSYGKNIGPRNYLHSGISTHLH